MARSGQSLHALISDLKGRGVFQTLGVYLVAAWAIIEVSSTIFPYVGIPDSAVTGVIIVLGLGIPVVVTLAWAFDVTPDGIRRVTVAPGDGRAAEGDAPVANRGRVPVVLGVLIVVVSLGGVIWIRAFEPLQVDLGAVAIFPFDVQGDSAVVGHLGEGMVTLLSRQLDGVAGLRSTDPSTILNLTAKDGAAALDPRSARRVAGQVGAGRFVLGSVTEVSGQVALSARLYGAEEGVEPAIASVEGAFSAVFELAEDLIAQLLIQQVGPLSRQMARTASRNTESLPAFKAFVDGERHLRRNRRDPAIAAFQQAVAEDGGFALAYYRLAVAAGLRRNYRLVESSLQQAAVFSDRLGEKDRRALEAFVSLRAGRIDEAEARYLALLADFPDSWEARYQLGDMLTEHNPARGRSAYEGLPLLEEVTRVDPAFVCPTCTMANFALADGDLDRSDSISYARVGPPTLTNFTVYAAASAAARGDSVGFDYYYNPRMNFFWQGPWIAAWFESYDWAERLVRPMLGTDRDNPLVRVHGTFILTDLLVGRGRWEEVPGLLNEAGHLARGRAMLREAFYLTQPLADPSEQAIAHATSRLQLWSGTVADEPDLESPLSPWLPQGRLYLLGLLEARRGEGGGAIAWADSLEATHDPPDSRGMAHDLALTIRADVALREGRASDALRLLEGVRGQIPVKIMDFVSTGPARREFADLFTQEHARLLRIEALLEMGRTSEARRWVENGFFRIGGNAVLAPTLRKLEGQTYEALGDYDGASDRYRRFLTLWEGADPAVQMWADTVRERLEAMGG